MNPFDYFEEAYCINLEERTDRWELIKKEFEKLGIQKKVNRFSAIRHQRGSIGCNLSHKKIVEIAKNKGLRNVLIFEDDCEFINTDIFVLSKSIMALNRREWDVFFIGGRLRDNAKKITNNLLKGKMTGCQSFAVNSNAYDKILGLNPYAYESLGSNKPWLGCFDAWYRENLDAYTVYPLMTVQRESHSDIGNRECAWKKKLYLDSFEKFVPENVKRYHTKRKLIL